MNDQPYAIIAKNLTKKFGSFTAVNQVSFNIRYGEIFGFLGPNGSGKTTTIRMALGLLKPSDGSVDVLGMRMDSNTSKMRPRIGYMSQRFSLYNDLTVMQNLTFYGKAYGLSNSLLKERIQDALAMAGLEHHTETRTKDLSGGWRQRLALSAAILHRPEVLFLDEPTAGVDPISRRAFWNLLYKLVAEPLRPLNAEEETRDAVTVFVTTHYMDEAEHCHRLAFIQHGNLIAQGSPAEIKQNMMHGEVLEISSSDAVESVKVLREAQASGELPVEEIELYGSLVHVIAPNVNARETQITKLLKKSGVHPGTMSIIDPSLEDVFISCMKN